MKNNYRHLAALLRCEPSVGPFLFFAYKVSSFPYAFESILASVGLAFNISLILTIPKHNTKRNFFNFKPIFIIMASYYFLLSAG